MHKVSVYVRTTHQYADGWSYLDDDKFVATVRLTPSKQVNVGDGYDMGGTYLQYARVPRNVNKGLLMQALRDTMGGSGCRHTHDCCGCATRYITVTPISSRVLQVRTDVSYNY